MPLDYIVHRAAIEHKAIDALSRVRTLGDDQTELDDANPRFSTHGEGECRQKVIALVQQRAEGPVPYRINRPSDIAARVATIDFLALQEGEKELLPITVEALLEGKGADAYCKMPIPEV